HSLVVVRSDGCAPDGLRRHSNVSAECSHKRNTVHLHVILSVFEQGPTMRDIDSLIKAARRYYTMIALLVLNTLIVLGGLELASIAATRFRASFQSKEETIPDPRAKSSYYVSEKWAPEYWQEFAQSRKQQYYPYTVWRRAPFKGKTIN